MKRFIFFVLALLCSANFVYSQKTKPTKEEKKQKRLENDSVFMNKPYPYILPIMGDKAHERGYRIPLPIGIMFNTLFVNQTLDITKISVGFGQLNSGEDPIMYNLENVVKFDKIVAKTSTYNFRTDVYLFPFLDVYGIFGKTKEANININMLQPFPMTVTTSVDGWYVGYGAMLSGKVGPIFLNLDANQSYNHNPRVDKPVVYSLASFRIGPIFGFKENPNQKIAVWVGAMYSHFDGQTVGTINTNDLAPNAGTKVAEMHQSLDNWYSGLSNINKIKYKLIYEALGNGLDKLSNGVNNTYIRYDLNKTSTRPWNMIVGAQWQINNHWQARTEFQFMGDRKATLLSLNYRFGIKGKTLFSNKKFNDSFSVLP